MFYTVLTPLHGGWLHTSHESIILTKTILVSVATEKEEIIICTIKAHNKIFFGK